MKTEQRSEIRGVLRFVSAVLCLALAASCATQPEGSPREIAAAKILREARSTTIPTETRAADYLQAASLTAPEPGIEQQGTLGRETYNAAAAELTVLLRSADGGRLWDRPLTLAGHNVRYHLRLHAATPLIWSPQYFTSFTPSAKIKEKLIKQENHQQGIGGSLVGVRKLTPRENFVVPHGLSAAVTATIDFKGEEATLALRRPAKNSSAVVQGRVRPLAADFSAPISYYEPPANLLLVGLMAGLRSAKYMETTGLYFLQPYDPDRIPVVFVHGLMSTPFTWVETINGLQADPEIRKHYQFWVFAYPTGNPILYSGLRFREELAKVDAAYPNHRAYVLVGHSMGGILSQLQVTTVTPAMWKRTVGAKAEEIFARNGRNSPVVRAMTFPANPRIKRVVFVCTPHRGSRMASSGIGRFGISLISLPLNIAKTITDSLTSAEIALITGSSRRLPNSVSGLKPDNPSFKVVDAAPITVAYHSVIGDRGKGGSPNSTDGVVPYWSSHLDGAKSECIVPGPHTSCALPQTIAELKRILLLHIKSS